MSKISELAKEWGVEPKAVVAATMKLGLKGKRPTSKLEDDEVVRVRQELGLPGRTPQVTLGTQRVVERAGEQQTETRLQANVIRRRAARPTGGREELPGSPDGDVVFSSPSLDLGDAIPPSLDLPPPMDFPPAVDLPPLPPAAERAAPALPVEAAPPAQPVETPAPELPPAPAAAVPVEAPPPPAARVAPPPAARVAPLPGSPRRGTQVFVRGTAPSLTPPAAPGFETPQGPKVLGRIDLRKTVPPPGATAWRPPGPGGAAAPAPGTTPGAADAPKRKGKKVIQKDDIAVMQERDFGGRGKRPMKKRVQPGKEVRKTEVTTPRASKRIIRISEVISVADLARAIGVKASEVMKKLIDMGVMATINQMLDHDTAVLVAGEFEYQVENVAFDVEQTLEQEQAEGTAGEAVPRAPVVTIMGHVDHGKTSLLDAIRATEVAAGEAGGITQHIGAYTVDVDSRMVTFLDTPGHEAFTAMRARGAKVTDIVVLVVAADDGIMPQTVEAINHSRAAEVPIIVAVNKIDKPDANLERVKQELGNYGLAPEEWGGDTTVAPVSAKTKDGIPHLLEMILLQADILELKANPARNAKGTIVEARLDRGRGPVATVLVQEGTLHVGDSFVCGTEYGRIRAMVDDKGKRITEAGPSMPVEILGLGGVPDAGDVFVALQDDQKARQIAEHRRGKEREAEMAKTAKVSLDDLYNQIQSGDVKELKVVLKADVQGSVEAIADALRRLSTNDVRLNVIHGSVGGITESDILLATASNAIVLGFNVRPEPKAAARAEHEGVDVRLYTIIYEALNEVREALEGLLEPTLRENVLGRVEVRQVFNISGVGQIAGCYVVDGKIQRGARARLLRDSVVVHDGKVGTLKRFKDDAREVAAGYECGTSLENYSDIKVGDVIEPYEIEQVARRLNIPAKGAQAERTA